MTGKEFLTRLMHLEETCSPTYVRVGPLAAYALLECIQLALRQPETAGHSARAIVEARGKQLEDYLASLDPEIGRLAAAGWGQK